jgi:hypothetical protein
LDIDKFVPTKNRKSTRIMPRIKIEDIAAKYKEKVEKSSRTNSQRLSYSYRDGCFKNSEMNNDMPEILFGKPVKRHKVDPKNMKTVEELHVGNKYPAVPTKSFRKNSPLGMHLKPPKLKPRKYHI